MAKVALERAADALDSQPTDEHCSECGLSCKPDNCCYNQNPPAATQPTVAAQQGSIGDDAEFRILTRIWRENAAVAEGAKAWRDLVVYVDNLLDNAIDSRAPAAPVAPLAPQTWIATVDHMPHQYREVHLKNREGHVRIGRWSLKGGGSWQLACFGSGEQSLWRKDDVTHWCTLAALVGPQQEGSEASNGCDLKAVHAFLMGESSLEGIQFGEKHPTKAGVFWWRLNLRAALAKG